jgi:hypothetical protein
MSLKSQNLEIRLFDEYLIARRESNPLPTIEAMIEQLPMERRKPFAEMIRTTALLQGISRDSMAKIERELYGDFPAKPTIITGEK